MAEFNVEVEQKDGISVIRSRGYINNLGGEKIAETCYNLINSGRKVFLLNLKESTVVNSIGISILIEVLEKVVEVKGQLAFCNLTPTVSKTFRIMGLLQYASLYPDENSAIGELTGR